jgi:hypothetical protein
MVRGLDKFKEYFEKYPNSYVIIGGAACDIIIGDASLIPRATKDIDMVLTVEAVNPDFIKQFWQFISDGNYETQEKSRGQRTYYRFLKPKNPDFPLIIELFSRKPDLVILYEPAHLTPIPLEDDLSSLSAILLSDDYYNYIMEHSILINGIHICNSEALICLKAIAFLDMTERKNKGEDIDERKIKKHKNDVFRLAVFLTAENTFELPESIKDDLLEFAVVIAGDLPGNHIFKEMGLRNTDAENVFEQLLNSFNLNDRQIQINK